MLNNLEIDSKTQKQILLITKAEELMTNARKAFQEMSKRNQSEDFTIEITSILSNCERASQIVDSIPHKDILPERLHLTQSTKNSITSQTVFYRKWISDYMETPQIFPKNNQVTDKAEIDSYKKLLAKLSFSERNLVSEYEKHKNSDLFSDVLGIYRKLLFRVIDFFEGYIAHQHDEETKSSFQRGTPFSQII